MLSKFELGDPKQNLQMFISLKDNNSSGLYSYQEWADYIMTPEWVKSLAEFCTQENVDSEDHRMLYLANLIQEMLTDHEIDFHKNLEDFDPVMFLNDGEGNPYYQAVNKLNSIGKLGYGFYEVFKPIGGSKERYIKVRMNTDGEMELSGVLELGDCEEVPMRHGSMEYLRNLNTGNKRYRFRLDIPFNDQNSALYWKPDQSEPFSEEEMEAYRESLKDEDNPEPMLNTIKKVETKAMEEGEVVDSSESTFTMHSELSSEQYVQTTDRTNVETTTDNGDGTKTIEFNSTIETRTDDTSQEDIMLYRHYKKYEKERFLRWYGTDHIPQFDLNSLTKQTICQSPVLKNDANSENFYADARNLIDVNLDRLNQDESTSISLLNLQPRAAIKVVEVQKGEDNEETEQYLEFMVGGKQQTSVISFDVAGKAAPVVQDLTRYAHTIEIALDVYMAAVKEMMYLELVAATHPGVVEAWKMAYEDDEFIP